MLTHSRHRRRSPNPNNSSSLAHWDQYDLSGRSEYMCSGLDSEDLLDLRSRGKDQAGQNGHARRCTFESRILVNDRMGYVAVSRAREDAIIYTNSIQELRGALDRRVDKEMALEATKESFDQRRNPRNESSQDNLRDRADSAFHQGLEESTLDNYEQAEVRGNDAAQSEEVEFEFAL